MTCARLMLIAVAAVAMVSCGDDDASQRPPGPRDRGVEEIIPNGWFEAGSHPSDYLLSVVTDDVHEGARCAYLEQTIDTAMGFGNMMQSISARRYRGQRVRLSGWMKTQGVQMAAFWMRVDGAAVSPLAFDNMSDRPVTGSTPWKKYDIVLDVADSSEWLNYGVMLSGPGVVRADDFRLEVVGPDVPSTDLGVPPQLLDSAGPAVLERINLPDEPSNLGFEIH